MPCCTVYAFAEVNIIYITRHYEYYMLGDGQFLVIQVDYIVISLKTMR